MKYHPLLNGFRRRKRNGKIARLPEATRERINHMLQDGVRYRDIIRALTQPADPPLPYTLSEMNLSNWYRGGHQEWCQHQQDLELARKFPWCTPVPNLVVTSSASTHNLKPAASLEAPLTASLIPQHPNLTKSDLSSPNLTNSRIK